MYEILGWLGMSGVLIVAGITGLTGFVVGLFFNALARHPDPCAHCGENPLPTF